LALVVTSLSTHQANNTVFEPTMEVSASINYWYPTTYYIDIGGDVNFFH
jgi:hypothetical protein